MQHGAQITDISEAKILDRDGRIARTFVVSFTVGEMGPFTLQVPEKEFEPTRVQQLVEERARAIVQLRGA